MMYNVSNVVLCVEVTYKKYSVIQEQCKEQNEALTSDHFQHCLRFMIRSRVSKHNFYSLFLNLSTLLCCIDLEISP